jgi:hypothetical protein
MLQTRAFDFDGADAVARDLDDLVGTAAKPDVSVLVDMRGIAAVIDPGYALSAIARITIGFPPEADEPGLIGNMPRPYGLPNTGPLVSVCHM